MDYYSEILLTLVVYEGDFKALDFVADDPMSFQEKIKESEFKIFLCVYLFSYQISFPLILQAMSK